MICINCYRPSTSVTNSRPHKKLSSVWRRRSCSACHAIFTTVERADLRYTTLQVQGAKIDFNMGKLIISIAEAFQHDRGQGISYASDIADTVMTKLSLEPAITPPLIGATTYEVLKRFDKKAAVAYALQHQIEL